MQAEEIRSFFEDSYRHIHLLDNECYECDKLKGFALGLVDRFRFIADNFSEDGVLKSDFSGRVLFFYQNASDFCKPFILEAAGCTYKNGKNYFDMGFLKIDLESQKKAHSKIWAEFEERIKNSCGKHIGEFFDG